MVDRSKAQVSEYIDDYSRNLPPDREDRGLGRQVAVVESGRGRMEVEHFRDLQILL